MQDSANDLSRKLDFKLSLPLLPGKVVSPLLFYELEAKASLDDKPTRRTALRNL